MRFAAVRGILRAMRATMPPGNTPKDDEAELVRKAREGDRRAFDRLHIAALIAQKRGAA